ncbi:16S rRNA (guanine(966)-N(2))-methyltransferase RsmD [Longirhabdus pacifica]|uniref:16S rRNA (guanine(966)-N(2))-methyltransferase RsmD n=1 Tax=Longirhabdus pacifica TaxID=2305227 RepID=UPI0010093506|nr:16S rRNA (guanine(966)-N(2))-methyltransferase RsmD [Longirhabdus pacifica]
MRVISGEARGRVLKAVPGQNTRPTTDKVKESLFSVIGPYFSDEIVLDLFAGTGSLGIEALSRGAKKAIFVDAERKSIEVVKHNIMVTGFEQQAEIYRNDAFRALNALHKREVQFQLVFLDPPYRMKNMDELLEQMQQKQLLANDSTVVIEHDAKHQYPQQIGELHRIRELTYGDIAISIYKHTEII